MIQPEYTDSRDRSLWFKIETEIEREYLCNLIRRIYDIHPWQAKADSLRPCYGIQLNEGKNLSVIQRIPMLSGIGFGIQINKNEITITSQSFPFANLWNAYSPYKRYSGQRIQSIDHLLRKIKMIYNIKDCQSLFGYAFETHKRYKGVCQLCGAGKNGLSFDIFRQMTVEHIIGKSQGGYISGIKSCFKKYFPKYEASKVKTLSKSIEFENMVTSCQFCNSMTSRYVSDVSMDRLFSESTGKSEEELLEHVKTELNKILKAKKEYLKSKQDAVRAGFDEVMKPHIIEGWTLYKGFEGGSVETFEDEDGYWIKCDEGTIIDFLNDDDKNGLEPVTYKYFKTKAEYESYLIAHYGKPRHNEYKTDNKRCS